MLSIPVKHKQVKIEEICKKWKINHHRKQIYNEQDHIVGQLTRSNYNHSGSKARGLAWERQAKSEIIHVLSSVVLQVASQD